MTPKRSAREDAHASEGVAVADVSDLYLAWQRSLFRVILRGTAGVFLLVVALMAKWGAGFGIHPLGGLRDPNVGGAMAVAAILATAFLVVAQTPLRAHRSWASGFFATTYMAIVVSAIRHPWAPGHVLGVCGLVIGAGLILGRTTAYALLATTSALLLVSGFLFPSLRHALPPAFDPYDAGNWVRVTLLVTLLIGSLAWLVRTAVAYVDRSILEAESALAGAHARHAATLAARVERLAKERELWDAQKLQTVAQLGEGVAHLVNNLLTVVRCACERAQGTDHPDVVEEAAEAIAQGALACGAKTRDLLTLSRPAGGGGADQADLATEVEALKEKITGRLRANVRRVFDTEPAARVGLAKAAIEHILMNLLLNAEQAMPRGGVVRIATRRVVFEEGFREAVDPLPRGAYAALTVEDDGPGMSPETLTRACEPFFTTRGRASHDGLGLTLVHGLARQARGSVAIATGPGGTRVTVYLAGEDERIADASQASATALASGEGPAEGSLSVADSAEPVVSEPGVRSAPPPSPAPTSTRPGVPTPWRVVALEAVLLRLTVVSLVLTVPMLLLVRARAWLYNSLALVGIALSLILVRRLRSLPQHLRLGLLLFLLLGASFFLVGWNSFLVPAGGLALALVVLLAASLGSRGAVAGGLVGAILVFVASGWCWSHRWISGDLRDFSTENLQTWVRVGVVVPALVFGLAETLFQVFDQARESLAHLQRARARLEASRQAHAAETDALLHTTSLRQQASRLETGGRLSGTVAHDLNNSFVAILGWAELLKGADGSEKEEALAAIEQAAEYAEVLVEGLQHQQVKHVARCIDAGDVVAAVQPILEVVFRQKSHAPLTLDVRTDAGCYLRIQPHSLRRLLLNLVANARDAMEIRGGRCEVVLRRIGEEVELVVSDTGCGMSSVMQGRLFTAFFTTKADRGTGLGLHSVAEIVTSTEGRIEVSSEVDVGTRFTVRWPVSPAPVATKPEAPRPSRPSTRARLLLADDDPAVRRLLARGLADAGYLVVEAADGDEAARMLESHGPFDALCTDIVMPGRSSMELCRQFAEEHPGKPIVFMSGHLQDGAVSPEGLGFPFVWLSKPFRVSKLASMLEENGAGRAARPG